MKHIKQVTVKLHEKGSAVSDKFIGTVGEPSRLRLEQLYAQLQKIVADFNDETMESIKKKED